MVQYDGPQSYGFNPLRCRSSLGISCWRLASSSLTVLDIEPITARTTYYAFSLFPPSTAGPCKFGDSFVTAVQPKNPKRHPFSCCKIAGAWFFSPVDYDGLKKSGDEAS